MYVLEVPPPEYPVMRRAVEVFNRNNDQLPKALSLQLVCKDANHIEEWQSLLAQEEFYSKCVEPVTMLIVIETNIHSILYHESRSDLYWFSVLALAVCDLFSEADRRACLAE